MKEQVEEIVKYIQEHCLWQFFSRTWDREDNIEGILSRAAGILSNKTITAETPAEKCWSADARILVAELKCNIPWLTKLRSDEIEPVFSDVKNRIREIAVEKSRNLELNVKEY
jgi:vanadium nitrogenase delta subunit